MSTALIVITCIVAAAVIAFFVWRGVRKYRLIKKIEAETGVKLVRRSVLDWLKAHKPSKRRLVQLYATLLYNANIKGFISGSIYTSATTKYVCVPGLNCYSCPGAVGACPLGALQNALAESSVRAPYYVIGILAIFGLTLARTVCGWLCPIGLGQELLYKVRTPKLKKSRVTRVLSYFKYVLLVVLVVILPLMYALRDVPLPAFCKYICPAGTFGGALALLFNPNNASMFGMLGGQFTWKFILLVVFIVASIFIFRFFCRFFCPLGAIYGFFNRIALIGVKVDKASCTDCGKCVAVCKMDVKRVGDHECINCGKCIPACPTKAIGWKGEKVFLRTPALVTTENGETVKPLPLTAGEVKISPTVEQYDGAEVEVKDSVKQTAVEPTQETIQGKEQTPEQTQTDTPQKPEKKKRGRGFWLQLTAWCAAAVVLIGALIFYNFIDVPKADDGGTPGDPDLDIGYNVGQTAPDFTVKLYGSDESFTLYDHRGKLTVINFWATWCTPCVKELPHFDELAANKPDINVIAIHGSSTRDVDEFINNNWPDHTITFAQDNLDGDKCLTYLMLGGKGMWPMTVIVDGDGKVVYNDTLSFDSYAELEREVNKYLQAE